MRLLIRSLPEEMPAHAETRWRRAARRAVPGSSLSAAAAQPLQRPPHETCAAWGTDDVESTPLLGLIRATVTEPSALEVTAKSLAATGGLPAGSCAFHALRCAMNHNGGGTGDEGACAEPCLGCEPVGAATCDRRDLLSWVLLDAQNEAAEAAAGVAGGKLRSVELELLQSAAGGAADAAAGEACGELSSVAPATSGVEFDRAGDVQISR